MRVKGSPYIFDQKAFSERIKRLRLKYDLKQHEIAKAIKKTRAAYGGCENGNFIPGLEMLMGIGDFYKKKGETISMDYLFGYSDNPEGVIIRSDQSEEIQAMKEKINTYEELIDTQKQLIKFLKESTKR